MLSLSALWDHLFFYFSWTFLLRFLHNCFLMSHRLSVVELRPSSSLSTGCVMSLRGDWPFFCHAGSGLVGRVRSAREKSLEILRRGWVLNPGHRGRQWAIPLSYHDHREDRQWATPLSYHDHREDRQWAIPLSYHGHREYRQWATPLSYHGHREDRQWATPLSYHGHREDRQWATPLSYHGHREDRQWATPLSYQHQFFDLVITNKPPKIYKEQSNVRNPARRLVYY